MEGRGDLVFEPRRDTGELRCVGLGRPREVLVLLIGVCDFRSERRRWSDVSDRGLLTGTVAFLFTDIEGSTELLRRLRADYAGLIEEHHRLLLDAVEANDGRLVDTQGDSIFAVFQTIRDAAAAAALMQRELAGQEWPQAVEVRVRMGLHVAEPEVAGGRYVGLGVHRAARISAAAHGGQVLLSQIAASLLADNEPTEVSVRGLGEYELKDFDGPEHLSQLVVDGLPSEFQPLRVPKVSEPKRPVRRVLLLAAAASIVAVGVAGYLVLADDGRPSVVPESLVKIDAETNAIVDVIPVGGGPAFVDVVGDYVFVASGDDATLSRVDTRDGDVRASGRYAADSGLAAQGKQLLWVASESRGAVSQVGAESLETTASLTTVEPHGAIGVGGGSVWVGEEGQGYVSRWGLQTHLLQHRYSLAVDDHPIGIAFGFGAAWLSLGTPADAVLRIDSRSGHTSRIPVGALPSQPAVGFDSIWVAMFLDNTVWRINPATGRPREIVTVGSAPLSVAVGAGSVWASNHCDGTVSRIDPETNLVVGTIEVGFHPQWIAADADFVWVGVAGKPILQDACE